MMHRLRRGFAKVSPVGFGDGAIMGARARFMQSDRVRKSEPRLSPRPRTRRITGRIQLIKGNQDGRGDRNQGPLDARTIINFYRVYLEYKDQTALHGVTFSVDNGEFLCLTGPSGAGKSSILRLIAMDALPTRGEVMVRGQLASKVNRGRIARLRREIGFVFQDFRLLGDRSVEDNVAFAQLVVGVDRSETKRNVVRVLTQVGLYDKRHRLPHELSGGEQQRVAIARAMVNSPKILLADEPTGNLDPVTAQEVIDLLFRINDGGTCVIFSTHDHEIVKTFGQRVMVVENGAIKTDIRRREAVDRTARLTDKMFQAQEVSHA